MIDKEDVNDVKKGLRYNTDKPRVELLSPIALLEIGKVQTYGAKKYSDDNWKYGMKWNIVIGCMFRHTLKIMMGEDRDEESGCLHASHVACNAMYLIEYFFNHKELDDRMPLEKYKGDKDAV